MANSSSDVISCLLDGKTKGIILNHNDDGSLTSPDCLLSNCRYFKQCDIIKNRYIAKAIQDKQL